MKLTTTEAGDRIRAVGRRFSSPSRTLLLLLVAAAGALSACADLVGPAGTPAAGAPTFNLAAPDCSGGFSQAQCDAIREALKWLREHSDPDCKKMGDLANTRFNDGKFVRDSTTTDYGYMYPSKDSTWLGNSAFDPGELANTIAHEESHHQGYEDLRDGSGKDAYALGDKCAKPATPPASPTPTSPTPTSPTPTSPTPTSPTPTSPTPVPTDTASIYYEYGTYSAYPAAPAGA